PRFGHEPLANAGRVGRLRVEDLERDLAPEAQVVGQVDSPGPAPSQQGHDPIAGKLASFSDRHSRIMGGREAAQVSRAWAAQPRANAHGPASPYPLSSLEQTLSRLRACRDP